MSLIAVRSVRCLAEHTQAPVQDATPKKRRYLWTHHQDTVQTVGPAAAARQTDRQLTVRRVKASSGIRRSSALSPPRDACLVYCDICTHKPLASPLNTQEPLQRTLSHSLTSSRCSSILFRRTQRKKPPELRLLALAHQQQLLRKHMTRGA